MRGKKYICFEVLFDDEHPIPAICGGIYACGKFIVE